MKYQSVAFLLLLMTACRPAWAEFYCGNDLVVEGDHKYQVVEKCGPPTYQDSRVEYRTQVLRGSGDDYPGVDFIRQVPVHIDEWTYDFGPRRFVQSLYFENDRLIWNKDYGYGTR